LFSSVKLVEDKYKKPLKNVTVIRIDIGSLVRHKRVDSGDINFLTTNLAGGRVVFKGIKIKESRKDKISLFIPDIKKWEEQLLWIEREVKDRICSADFKEKISEIIKVKYSEVRGNRYIRKKRVYKNWKATGS
jgi:hypothetical protein